jgi:nucleoside-diphosphate-sugar epimerase
MHIAILGATSQIAKDLILCLSRRGGHDLTLFARRPEVAIQWLGNLCLAGRYKVSSFDAFGGNEHFDALINFVGVGNPAQAAAMGASIFDVTLKYDELALNYLHHHPETRYLFMSSGAAYGGPFHEPAGLNTRAVVAINNLLPQEWYGVAKLHAECRHRAHPELAIIDIRVFNYFSRTQDISARFLITDILRAIRDRTVLKTSPENILRDFLHPADFHNLVLALLSSPAANAVVDCYSLAPVDKFTLLSVMQSRFGLQYEVLESSPAVNATGNKSCYYSRNSRAAEFGYQPSLTSIEGILREAEEMLHGVIESVHVPSCPAT